MNGYNLTECWFSFVSENNHKVECKHTALYLYIVEQFNKRHWVETIGLPTDFTMGILNIRSYKTYKNTLQDLVDFGFINMVQLSKNQFTSNVIALVKKTKANSKHIPKQDECDLSIIKHINNKTYNNLSDEQIDEILSHYDKMSSKKIYSIINRFKNPKKEDENNTIISEIEDRTEFYHNYQGNKMYLAIVFRFYDLLIEKYPKSSTLLKAELEKWLDEVRLSIESDGTTIQRLIAIIEFLKWQVKEVKGIDTFWITQVQSITSIRGKNKDGVFKIDNIASKMNEYSNRCPEFKNHIDKEIANFTNKFKL